jgi:hypothetical protein
VLTARQLAQEYRLWEAKGNVIRSQADQERFEQHLAKRAEAHRRVEKQQQAASQPRSQPIAVPVPRAPMNPAHVAALAGQRAISSSDLFPEPSRASVLKTAVAGLHGVADLVYVALSEPAIGRPPN